MRRYLGRSGIEVSAPGMDCWAIGGPFWYGETPHGRGEVDDEESIRAIHAALIDGKFRLIKEERMPGGEAKQILKDVKRVKSFSA